MLGGPIIVVTHAGPNVANTDDDVSTTGLRSVPAKRPHLCAPTRAPNGCEVAIGLV